MLAALQDILLFLFSLQAGALTGFIIGLLAGIAYARLFASGGPT